ncbi:MAG: aspartate aminotransferase family protein [Anaerolineae bacterium]|nr:aspartate aminotransferase family protein [Anaerolineae bacterium]
MRAPAVDRRTGGRGDAVDTIELERRHAADTYSKREIVLTRGQGAHVWDDAGRLYIDCVGGHGVSIVGHCHPSVTEAICRQAGQLVTCPGTFYSETRARLLARLAEITGLERAFLCNSGAEAVEGALKFARLSTGRRGIVAAMRGFHGRTMGALSTTWNKAYRTPFMPLLPGVTHVPYDNVDRLDGAVDADTAAVLVEVVQGEGGVRPGSASYLRALRRLCDERGALLIIDEVQTGFGRTGKLFAFQHYDLQPDILCLAKGIAGGVPMGAVMLGAKVHGLRPGVHGSTFGGNPLACAAALATIDAILDEDLPAQAHAKGEYLVQQLIALDLPLIREVRGMGLMIGIELRTRAKPYLEALLDRGVLALPAGPTVVRLLPPLVISYADLDIVVAALADVLAADLPSTGGDDDEG